MPYPFLQVDVFTANALRGNPLAVVFDADDMSDDEMARFANWTNLSETTFILKPADPSADYRVRIFTPNGELPFAGHPTLGTCFAWLRRGGLPKAEKIIQECEVGLISIRQKDNRLFFAAPPLRKSGPVEEAILSPIINALNLTSDDIVDASWTDNGPQWISILLKDVDTVLKVKPDFVALNGQKVGIVAALPNNAPSGGPQFEVRAFTSFGTEDPVTGSLNAGIAQWLIGTGKSPKNYIARQGTILGRDGRVFVESADGEIWIGGDVVCCIEGQLNSLNR